MKLKVVINNHLLSGCKSNVSFIISTYTMFFQDMLLIKALVIFMDVKYNQSFM